MTIDSVVSRIDVLVVEDRKFFSKMILTDEDIVRYGFRKVRELGNNTIFERGNDTFEMGSSKPYGSGYVILSVYSLDGAD